MSEHEKTRLQLPELTNHQATRVIGGAANILADMIAAYVEMAGPHCGNRLLQLRHDLIRNVQNREQFGIAAEDERAVVQALMVVIDGGYSSIRFERPNAAGTEDGDPGPDN